MSTTQTRAGRLILAWAALSTLFLSVACSHGSSANPPPPPVTPAPVGTAADSGVLDHHAGLPAHPHAIHKPSDTASADKSTGGSDHVAVIHGNKAQPNGDQHSDHKPDDLGVVIHLDASNLTSEQIFADSEKQGQLAPGLEAPFKTTDGSKVYYAGGAQDFLREQLQGLIDAEPNAEIRRANREFSKNVSEADYDIDLGAKTGRVSLQFARAGQVMHADFSGTLDNDRKMRVGDTASGDQIAIEATCLDQNGRCHTLMLKVLDGSGPTVRTAIMIARDARASLHIVADDPGVAKNPDYDYLITILNNTFLQPSASNKVTSLHMQTSETINGPSSFFISMDLGLGQGQTQTLDWGGPLIKAADSDRINMDLHQPRSKASINGAPAQVPYLLSSSIRSVRTRRDDGRGNLQIELTVVARTPDAHEDTITLTFSRINNLIVTPTSL